VGDLWKLHSTKFRLIDAGETALVETNHDHSIDYAALSCVWGDVVQHAMNAEIYSDPSHPPFRNLSSIQLPRTIADALQVVRLLGLRYPWVDLVCIDQRNAEERSDVISRMTVIYHNASLTLVAAAGDCADAGLPGISTSLRRPEILEIRLGPGEPGVIRRNCS
jgi:hypothetical protein